MRETGIKLGPFTSLCLAFWHVGTMQTESQTCRVRFRQPLLLWVAMSLPVSGRGKATPTKRNIADLPPKSESKRFGCLQGAASKTFSNDRFFTPQGSLQDVRPHSGIPRIAGSPISTECFASCSQRRPVRWAVAGSKFSSWSVRDCAWLPPFRLLLSSWQTGVQWVLLQFGWKRPVLSQRAGR